MCSQSASGPQGQERSAVPANRSLTTFSTLTLDSFTSVIVLNICQEIREVLTDGSRLTETMARESARGTGRMRYRETVIVRLHSIGGLLVTVPGRTAASS